MCIFSHQRLLLPGLISFILSLKKLPTRLLLPSEFPTSKRMQAGPLQEGPSQLPPRLQGAWDGEGKYF